MAGACSPAGDNLSAIHYDPESVILPEPDNFVKMQIPADNPLTKEGIALGKRLFFDSLLSVNHQLACVSCHQPALAFTDGKPLSTGVHGHPSHRSAPSLINVGYYYKGLFWDGRAPTLEAQALIPVTDSLEMASNWDTVEHRLRQHLEYPMLFRMAFGIKSAKEINRFLVAKALAQYERTLVNYNAKFDKVTRREAVFTAQEQRGRDIFFDAGQAKGIPFSECSHCHADPLFTTLEYFNNGIEKVKSLADFPDMGRGAVTGLPSDRGKFKTPTLRNITLTAPYMHDGRFATLDEVLDHYISGGHFADNLNPNVRKLRLTTRDKQDLIAFLKTLTDSSFVNTQSMPTFDKTGLTSN